MIKIWNSKIMQTVNLPTDLLRTFVTVIEVQNFTRNFPRQGLHAKLLGFVHPITGEKLKFESDLPEDMQELVWQFKKPT